MKKLVTLFQGRLTTLSTLMALLHCSKASLIRNLKSKGALIRVASGRYLVDLGKLVENPAGNKLGQ
jgi:hypothetical protein